MRRKEPKDGRCRVCGVRPRLIGVTDGMGRITYVERPCIHEVRLAAKCCAECGLPHGRPAQGGPRRCTDCQTKRDRARTREFMRQPEQIKASADRHRRAYQTDPKARQAKIEHNRTYRKKQKAKVLAAVFGTAPPARKAA